MSAADVSDELELAGAPALRRRGPWRRALARFARQPVSLAALCVLLALFVVGALAGKLAPYGFADLLDEENLPPTLRGHHFFGTDLIGHDAFSRTLYGLRTTIEVSLSIAAIAGAIGIVVGSLAGYYSRWIDATLMRLVDFVIAVPPLAFLFVAIVYLGVLTPLKIAEVLSLVLWTPVARVVRATLASLRETEYVEAARAAGGSDLRIFLRHLLPNAFGPIIVAVTLLVGQAVLLESTVEYLEYGIDQSTSPSLGNLIADNTRYGLGHGATDWWLWVFPAIVIVVLLICVNLVGDGLDEAFNPSGSRRRER